MHNAHGKLEALQGTLAKRNWAVLSQSMLPVHLCHAQTRPLEQKKHCREGKAMPWLPGGLPGAW
jgi:hypothetical protein